MTMQSILADSIAALLLISACWHLFRPVQTERLMSDRTNVRFVGGLLLLLAVSCFWCNGWFFKAISGLLLVSDIWRLFFPEHSIRTQRSTYPRWVHGCFLLGGAIAVWTLKP